MHWQPRPRPLILIDGVPRSDVVVTISSFVDAQGKPVANMSIPDRCEVQYTDDTGEVVTRRIKEVNAGERTLRIVTDTPPNDPA